MGADASAGVLRTLVLTTDADAAVGTAACVAAEMGAGGALLAALTTASRAQRVLTHSTPVGAAIPVTAAAALLARAALPMADIAMVVIQMPTEGDTASLEALDTVLAEVPKGARRVLVAAGESAALDALAERHLFKARRVREDTLEEVVSTATIRALTTGRAARWETLRRLMDELDPASTVVVAADAAEEGEARHWLAALGYPTDGAVRVSRDAVPEGVTLVVFPSIPAAPALTTALAATPANLVVLCGPGEVAGLRSLAAHINVRPWNLDGPLAQAESKEAVTRAKLRSLLASGTLARELKTLAPLFDEFDASEIAAAALALATEAERAAAKVYIPAASAAAPTARPAAPAPRNFDRADRDRGPRPDRGVRGDRPPRTFDRADRGERSDRGERPAPRSFDRGDRGDRPAPRGADRGERGERPAPRSFDRGERGGSDRPAPRSFDRGDRPAPRSFDRGDRPAPRSFDRGDRPAPSRGPRDDRPRDDRGPSRGFKGPPRKTRG
jgi:hypothetical protein